MSATLTELRNHPTQSMAAGEVLIAQGDHTGNLYVLIEGAVEVAKDGIIVAKVAEPGAIFGDLSALLDVPHTAEVRVTKPSRFYIVQQAKSFLEKSPLICLELCELLARRLDGVNKYLVDVKRQFEGSDHLAMVDGLLDTLMHRQPRKRVAPSASTLRDPEVLD